MTNDLAKLMAAASFAAEKHREQKRKNTLETPYINHPIAVAEILSNDGGINDVELLMAALLHDTVEDTETSTDELTKLFGEAVCELVGEVTDDKSLAKEERKRLQIENAPHKSDKAKQLKIADKICNIRDIMDDSPAGWDVSRKIQYLQWGEQVVAGCRGVNAALDQLFDKELQAARVRMGVTS